MSKKVAGPMILSWVVLLNKDCHMTSLRNHNGSTVLPETFWMQNLQKTMEIMLTYLSDLMEDTTDSSWQGIKASHAVLLCEMESRSCNLE